MLVDVLLVIGYDRLGDSLTDGVDLRCMTTAGDSYSDIDARELIHANNQERFVDL